jgi:hypothetical protein
MRAMRASVIVVCLVLYNSTDSAFSSQQQNSRQLYPRDDGFVTDIIAELNQRARYLQAALPNL